jgi:hypothetical protein
MNSRHDALGNGPLRQGPFALSLYSIGPQAVTNAPMGRSLTTVQGSTLPGRSEGDQMRRTRR